MKQASKVKLAFKEILVSKVIQGFKEFNFMFSAVNTVQFRVNIAGEATGEYIAIDNVRVLGTVTGPPLTGDLNTDGFVGIADLNIVLGNWNLNVPPGDPSADPSGDNFNGIADLNVVLGNWNAGTPPGASAVPEPGTLAVLGLGVPVLLRRPV